MKINAIKFYTALFVLLLFLQLYLPSFKTNAFIQIAALLLFFQLDKFSLTIDYLRQALPIALLFSLGFLGLALYHYPLVNVIKDLFHFSKPLLGLTVGYLFYKRINDFRLFIKTIVLVGFASALVHFCIILLFSNTESVSGIREFARDNFLELFALLFLAYYKKFNNENLFAKRTTYYTVFCILLISCIMYFSRTMIVAAILALLSIHGYTYITRTTVKVFIIFTALIIGFYAYLYSVNIQRGKPGLEAFLYKVKIAPYELFKTKIDRENHTDLWDHWRGYEAKRAFALMNENPATYIFGNGHGSLVNLKFAAPLTADGKGMRYISELHNGYVYILYKTGIIGLSVYLVFLTGLYKNIYRQKNMVRVYISAIGLIFFFTTLTITGIYNSNDTIIFILGALLFFNSQTDHQPIES